MKKVILYKSIICDPYLNFAIEEFLFNNATVDTIIIFLWQNEKTVVIGRYQNVYEEVNIDYAKKEGIKIIRRNTGGGAVYHDIGNLNYSFIFCSDQDLVVCQELISDVLRTLEVPHSWSGRNDILVNGDKISGTASCKKGDKQLFHGTLLVNSNLFVLKDVLTRNNKIISSKSVKSMSHSVINLSTILGNGIDVEDIIEAFKRVINSDTEMVDSTLSFTSLREVIYQIANEKYRTDMWNYGFCPLFNFRDTIHQDFGNICINANIDNDIITEFHITGDFFVKGKFDMIETFFLRKSISDLPTSINEMNAEFANDIIVYGIKNDELIKLIARELMISPRCTN